MDYVKRVYNKDFRTIRLICKFLMAEKNLLVVKIETIHYGGYRLWYAIG